MRGLKKIAWEGDTQTYRQTDIATTRKNRPKGRFFEKKEKSWDAECIIAWGDQSVKAFAF